MDGAGGPFRGCKGSLCTSGHPTEARALSVEIIFAADRGVLIFQGIF
jgi:hypothetical protein